jgi:hypothetical protein
MQYRSFFVFCFLMLFSVLSAEVKVAKWYVDKLPVSDLYQIDVVQLNTKLSCPVFVSNCNIYDSKMPGSMPKDSIPLTEYKGRSIHFTNFSFDNSIDVIVTIKDIAKLPNINVRVLPERFGVKAVKISANSFKFTISKQGQYSIEIGENGYKQGLLVFANPLENDLPVLSNAWKTFSNATAKQVEAIEPNTTSIYFKAGIHNIGKYLVPAHIKNIYVEDGAWVYGSFVMLGADKSNVKIWGRGVLSGAKLNFRESHQIEASNDANNITVSGITITDYSYFAVRLLGKNNLVEWTKITGGWIWNCDGIAAWEGSTIRNCFIWANDDNIKIYEDNIIIEDVVCWQLSNGAIFQLNWGKMKAKNCVIRNVDIVRAEWHDDRANNGIISCRTSGGANSNFLFENIRTDNPIAFIFRLSPQGNTEHPIENFIFRNWDIKMDLSKNKTNYIEGATTQSLIKGLIFENVKINNTLLTNENYKDLGRFSVKNVEKLVFK